MTAQKAKKPAQPVSATKAMEQLQLFQQLWTSLRLTWRLLLDGRVPSFPKIVVIASIIYVIVPIDLLPDFIPGIGQIDDFAVAFVGIRWLWSKTPPEVMQEHLVAMGLVKEENKEEPPPRTASRPFEEQPVDATWRDVTDEPPSQAAAPTPGSSTRPSQPSPTPTPVKTARKIWKIHGTEIRGILEERDERLVGSSDLELRLQIVISGRVTSKIAVYQASLIEATNQTVMV